MLLASITYTHALSHAPSHSHRHRHAVYHLSNYHSLKLHKHIHHANVYFRKNITARHSIDIVTLNTNDVAVPGKKKKTFKVLHSKKTTISKMKRQDFGFFTIENDLQWDFPKSNDDTFIFCHFEGFRSS